MVVLQKALELLARRFKVRVPPVATLEILNITLMLLIWIKNQYELGNILHQFMFGQHTTSIWKAFRVRLDPCQCVVGEEVASSLVHVSNLTKPDDITLMGSLPMTSSTHLFLRFLVAALLGLAHSAKLGLAKFIR